MGKVPASHWSRLRRQDGSDINSVAIKRRKLHHVGLPTGVNVYDGPYVAGPQLFAFIAGDVRGQHDLLMFLKQFVTSFAGITMALRRPHSEDENGVTCRFFPLYGGLTAPPFWIPAPYRGTGHAFDRWNDEIDGGSLSRIGVLDMLS